MKNVNNAHLSNELIAHCLLQLAPEERTPPVLLQWRAKGRALKDVVESEPFWRLFSAKAAARPGQSRCEAFIERMGERPPSANRALMGIYRGVYDDVDGSNHALRFYRCQGEDPDLDAAKVFMFLDLHDTGRIIRNDSAIVHHFLDNNCRRLVRNFRYDSYLQAERSREFTSQVILVPAKHWTKGLARQLSAELKQGEIFIEPKWSPFKVIPRHFWRDEQMVRANADAPALWFLFEPAFKSRPEFAQELFEQFVSDHSARSLQEPPSLNAGHLFVLWSSLPADMRQDPVRLDKLIALPTTDGRISGKFAPYVTDESQLMRLVAAKPYSLFDLMHNQEWTVDGKVKASSRILLAGVKDNYTLIRLVIERFRVADDTRSIEWICNRIISETLRQRLMNDGVIPRPRPIEPPDERRGGLLAFFGR